ncbi:unnamed protein product [Lasius platythorax]|uniref:Uncharacterized protein n=1 Tax=Lasius platythorax TaxID=488582 RepID=A0AAV2NCQ5_9HYME
MRARPVRVRRNRRETARALKDNRLTADETPQHDWRLIGHLAVNGPIHRRPSSVPQINFAYGRCLVSPPEASRGYNDRLTVCRRTTATFHPGKVVE